MHNYYVYIVDSQSPDDLLRGRSIAAGLYDALTSIRIPSSYYLTVNKEKFQFALSQIYQELYIKRQQMGGAAPYPIIHLSMHGNKTGIGLTSGEYISWKELEAMLMPFKTGLGEATGLCMGSCEGMHAVDWGGLSSEVYKFIVGNAEAVAQSDLTTGFLTFYNGLFFHSVDLDKLVEVMRQASFDPNFYYTLGAGIKNVMFGNHPDTAKE